MTLLFGEDPGLNRVVAGTVVEASYYGDMTYYSIAIQAVERPIVVSMRKTIGRPSLVSGEKGQVGGGPESLVPLVSLSPAGEALPAGNGDPEPPTGQECTDRKGVGGGKRVQ